MNLLYLIKIKKKDMKKIKKLSLLLLMYTMFSCSNNSEEDLNSTPEFYDVKYEVIGTVEAQRIIYTSDDGDIEENSVKLPYEKEFKYRTEKDGEDGVFGYKRIGLRLYSLDNSYVQEVRLYIDGELVDSQTTPPTNPNNLWQPWSVGFDYLRRK